MRPPPGFALHTNLRGPCDLRIVVGHVGERLVEEAMGAEPWRAADIPVKVVGGATATSTYVRPDLWLPSETAIVEVKSALKGRRYYVTVEQLDLYRRIHLTSTWPAPKPYVYYAFVGFAHPYPLCDSARHAAGDKGRHLKRPYTVGEVMAALLTDPPVPIVVPLPIVSAWASAWGTTGKSWSGPLSPMLGDYAAYYRFTVEKVEKAMEASHFGAGKVGAVATTRPHPKLRWVEFPRPRRAYDAELPGVTVELF